MVLGVLEVVLEILAAKSSPQEGPKVVITVVTCSQEHRLKNIGPSKGALKGF